MAVSVYLDASVIVALFLDDPFSARAEALFRPGPSTPVVSDFAAAEFASAVARRVRTGQLTQVAAREAFEDLDVWLSGEVHRLQISSADVAAAGGFVRRLDLNLRTPDAIHIAMCRRAGATLATFDMRLGEAAQVLGLMLA